MADEKISKLTKILLGGALAGSLFLGYNLLTRKSANSFQYPALANEIHKNMAHMDSSNYSEQQNNSKQIYSGDFLKKEPTKISLNKSAKSTKENLLASQFLDIVENNDSSVDLTTHLEKNEIQEGIKRFEKYFKVLPKKSYSQFTLEEVKDLFIKMDSSINGLVYRFSGECIQTALLYHAIGEHYNLPIHLSLAPPIKEEYHIFVRWDSDGKHDPLNQNNPINKGDLNWDNNSARYNYFEIPYGSDEHFISIFGISKKSLENKVYLKNLNKKEVLALAYAAKSERYGFNATHHVKEKDKRKKLFEEALKFSNKSLELDSLCIMAYDTKAKIFGRGESQYNDFENAREIIDKAIELSPSQEDLIHAKADIYSDEAASRRNNKIDEMKNKNTYEEGYDSWDEYYGGKVELKKELDSLALEGIKLYKKKVSLLEERIKKELSKGDDPRRGSDYGVLSYLELSRNNVGLYIELCYSMIYGKSELPEKKAEELGLHWMEHFKYEEYSKKEQERMNALYREKIILFF